MSDNISLSYISLYISIVSTHYTIFSLEKKMSAIKSVGQQSYFQYLIMDPLAYLPLERTASSPISCYSTSGDSPCLAALLALQRHIEPSHT